MFAHKEFSYVFNKISPEVVDKTKDLIEKSGIVITSKILGYDTSSYDNLIVAGRLLIFHLRRRCAPTISEYADDLKDRLQEQYYNYIKLNSEKMQAEIDKRLESDYDFDYFSASSMVKTYLAKMSYDNDDAVETPQYMYMRIAIQLYSDVSIEKVLETYIDLSNKLYTPATPTILNSCMKKNYLSSCFLIRVEDDSADIQNSITSQSAISRGNGAVGIDVSLLRHSEIDGRGESSGPLNFMGIFNASTYGWDQNGARKGATTISIRSHHLDLEAFIKSSEKSGTRYDTFPDINTAIFYSEIFIERIKKREKWTLFCPAKTKSLNNVYGSEFTKEYEKTEKLAIQRERELLKIQKEYEQIKESEDYKLVRDYKKRIAEAKRNRINYKIVDAFEIFKLIVDTQRRTGMPYLNNGDAINLKCNQNNIGTVSNLNLCQEISLVSGYDKKGNKNIPSCNLSSLSFRKFVKSKINREVSIETAINQAFDFNFFGKIVQKNVENIDQVIDHTKYVLDKENKDGTIEIGDIHATNLRNRPEGIGSQGFAELLYKLDLRIEDDKEYITLLNKKVFACRYFNGIAKSVALAIQKGKYENFEGSELSNGNFQFDLWNKELKIKGFNKVRTEFSVQPEPISWEQKPILLPNGDVIEPTWDDLRRVIKSYGVRNSMLFAEMPTATSSQILMNTETNEMPQSNLYSRKLQNGSYPVLNRYLVYDLQEINLWSTDTMNYIQANNGSIEGFDTYVNTSEKYPNFDSSNLKRLKFLIQKYKTMWQCSQKYLLKLNADRAEYVCNSISLNIYMLQPSDQILMASHLYAHDLGLKTIMYYLRQGTAIETVKFTIDPELLQEINKIKGASKLLENINLEVEKKKEVKKEIKNEIVVKEEQLEICDPNDKNCLSCGS